METLFVLGGLAVAGYIAAKFAARAGANSGGPAGITKPTQGKGGVSLAGALAGTNKTTPANSDALCAAADMWYEQTPVHNYVPRNVWYGMPCYKRVEAAANPPYFLNAEGIRMIGDLAGIRGISLTGAGNAVSSVGQAANSAYNSTKSKLGF